MSVSLGIQAILQQYESSSSSAANEGASLLFWQEAQLLLFPHGPLLNSAAWEWFKQHMIQSWTALQCAGVCFYSFIFVCADSQALVNIWAFLSSPQSWRPHKIMPFPFLLLHFPPLIGSLPLKIVFLGLNSIRNQSEKGQQTKLSSTLCHLEWRFQFAHCLCHICIDGFCSSETARLSNLQRLFCVGGCGDCTNQALFVFHNKVHSHSS